MRLDVLRNLDRRARGPLDRVDPRVKIVAALASVIAIVATPLGAWSALAAEALVLVFLVGLTGVSPRLFAARWLGLVMVFGLLSFLAAWAHPARRELGLADTACSMIARNSLALLVVVVLSQVTPFPVILKALARLGMPAILISTLMFMERYVYVLLEELERMTLARRARMFRRGSPGLAILTGLLGVLFLRAWERGDRVHSAMLARGWDGVVRSLEFDGTTE